MKILDVYLDNNIGDDLMLKMFLTHFSDETFYIINDNEKIKLTFKEYKNLKFIHSYENINLKHISHYITIGGSVFNNSNNVLGKLIRLKRLLFLKKLKKNGTKIFTIGSNLGPFKDKVGYKIVLNEIYINDLITVRDKSSFDLINSKNKLLYDDIVTSLFSYLFKKDEFNREKNIVGVSLHNNKDDLVNKAVINNILKAIEILINEKNIRQIRLFNFDIMNEDDSVISEKIYSMSNHKENIKIYSYNGENTKYFLNKYYECEYMMGIRFHSLILSSIFNQKYLGYSYSNKMIDYAKFRYFVNVFSIDDITYGTIANLDKYYMNTHENITGNMHFKMLEELI